MLSSTFYVYRQNRIHDGFKPHHATPDDMRPSSGCVYDVQVNAIPSSMTVRYIKIELWHTTNLKPISIHVYYIRINAMVFLMSVYPFDRLSARSECPCARVFRNHRV